MLISEEQARRAAVLLRRLDEADRLDADRARLKAGKLFDLTPRLMVEAAFGFEEDGLLALSAADRERCELIASGVSAPGDLDFMAALLMPAYRAFYRRRP
jgi:hypothetical protein